MTETSRGLSALFEIDRRERAAVLLAFLYFFTLLTSYYMLRSVREAFGVRVGPEHYDVLYTTTFACMLLVQPLYGFLVSRYPRRVFVPLVYSFFLACLIGFAVGWEVPAWRDVIAPVFFVWLSVANLFVVVVFWSYMVDVFDDFQAKRLFGFIAAGGSAGGLCGAGTTMLIAGHVEVTGVLWLAAAFLAAAIVCAVALGPRARVATHRRNAEELEQVVGGTSFAAFRLVLAAAPLRWLAVLMVLSGVGGGILYTEQGHAVRAMLSADGERAAYFARIDLAVNLLALTLELLVARWLFLRFGIARLMTFMPLLLALGFALLMASPGALMIAVFQVLSRAVRFAFGEPALSSCYTSLDREIRYKGKGFIDTFVYRLSDVVTQWAISGVKALGAGGMALFAGGGVLALVAAAVGYTVGRQHERRVAAGGG
jgi:AAA family ATP:ADP antiporter